MASSNNLKSSTKVVLSSNVQELVNDEKATLTFTFSQEVTGFDISDIRVKNGTVTNLREISQGVYQADFIGGVSDRSGMSTIQLSGDYNGSNGTPSNTLTIKNSGVETTVTTKVPTVGFVCNNASVVEGNSGTTDMVFTLQLSESSKDAVTVNYTTALKTYGTATVNQDFVAQISSVTFAAGETSKTFVIKVNADTTYETNESLYVDLVSAQGAVVVDNNTEGLRSNWAVGTIVNDDTTPLPTVGFISNNASMKEGNSGLTAMSFTVKLSESSTEAVTVNYTTGLKTYGSAKANLDFVPVTDSITFAAGETSKVIQINVIGDTINESNENFYVDLTSATNAIIVKNGSEGLRSSWVVGTIVNDDVSATPTVGFVSNNASVKEGNSGTTDMNFTLQLSKSSSEVVTVNYTSEQKTYGTAKGLLDYTPVTQSVTFAAGETSKVVTVKVVGDSVYEANENFYMDIKSVTGATMVTNGSEGLRSNWAVGTILNDDVLSVVTTTSTGIYGTTSKDVIGGTAASDFIYGKGGADLITGLAGNDTFVFSNLNATKFIADASQVMDFKDGFDLIGLQNLNYSDLHIAQGSGVNYSDTIVSDQNYNTLVVLVGMNSTAVDATDFVQM